MLLTASLIVIDFGHLSEMNYLTTFLRPVLYNIFGVHIFLRMDRNLWRIKLMDDLLVLLQVANLSEVSLTDLALERPDSRVLPKVVLEVARLLKDLVAPVDSTNIVQIVLFSFEVVDIEDGVPLLRNIFKEVFVHWLVIFERLGFRTDQVLVRIQRGFEKRGSGCYGKPTVVYGLIGHAVSQVILLGCILNKRWDF